jgi:hypothetical protein
MSDFRDPRRLELEGPSAVTQVIDGLRTDGPSAESMRRMGEKLGPMLDGPSPASSFAARWLSRPAAKLLLVALASGALLGVVPRALRRTPAPENETTSTAASAVAPARRPAETAPQPAALAIAARWSPQSARPAAQPTATRPQPSSEATARPTPALRSARTRSKRASVQAPTPRDRDDQAAVSPVASTDAVPAASPTSPTEAARPSMTTAALQAPSDKQAPAAPAVLDEAGLLQQARRLARERPEAALRLLGEHEQRFPHGILVPEREVLAIQLLRSLSRASDADARLAAFAAHYPHSVYLQRLEHSAGSRR